MSEDRPATMHEVREIVESSEHRMIEMIEASEHRMIEMMREMQTATEHRMVQTMREMRTATEERLTEAMRDMQTELLRGFAAFSQGQTIRLRKVEADQSNLDASLSGRVNVLEGRLLEIELRLGIVNGGPRKN
jgi:hypothetical protein